MSLTDLYRNCQIWELAPTNFWKLFGHSSKTCSFYVQIWCHQMSSFMYLISNSDLYFWIWLFFRHALQGILFRSKGIWFSLNNFCNLSSRSKMVAMKLAAGLKHSPTIAYFRFRCLWPQLQHHHCYPTFVQPQSMTSPPLLYGQIQYIRG